MKVTGKVVARTFNKGSKSEYEGVEIHTTTGLILNLRRGAPFSDPELNKLAGKTIEAVGSMTYTGNNIVISDWKVVEDTL